MPYKDVKAKNRYAKMYARKLRGDLGEIDIEVSRELNCVSIFYGAELIASWVIYIHENGSRPTIVASERKWVELIWREANGLPTASDYEEE
jgi:hypothetical protein